MVTSYLHVSVSVTWPTSLLAAAAQRKWILSCRRTLPGQASPLRNTPSASPCGWAPATGCLLEDQTQLLPKEKRWPWPPPVALCVASLNRHTCRPLALDHAHEHVHAPLKRPFATGSRADDRWRKEGSRAAGQQGGRPAEEGGQQGSRAAGQQGSRADDRRRKGGGMAATRGAAWSTRPHLVLILRGGQLEALVRQRAIGNRGRSGGPMTPRSTLGLHRRFHLPPYRARGLPRSYFRVVRGAQVGA